MMYNKKMVATIKSGGKIMREDGETVHLPFGEEYSILLKNLNTQRAVVKIEIDGVQVIDGGLIVDANKSIDLERFLLGNMNEGPKFKFIEKTEQISDHRGDKIEDGIIRISYQFEAPYVQQTYTYTYNAWDSGSTPTVYRKGMTGAGGQSIYNMNVGGSLGSMDTTSFASSTTRSATPQNDAGITTHGEKSSQKFQTGHVGMLELDEHVICLNLKGFIGNLRVAQPVTVDRKITCATCGKVSPSSIKFCGNCGTNLTYQY